jgi:hypothetical protein
MLAESHAVSDKGLRHTITLRKGVKFHNGKEMTSADVVPSLRRWGRVASVGRTLWKYVEAVEAKDPYTVVVSMKQPSASLIYGLSEPHAAIYPKESIEAAGEGQLKEFIGTGPFRFVEHRPDRHIKLARFKGLQRSLGALQRLRRQAHRLLRRDPVSHRARQCGAAGGRGDRRVSPRHVHPAGTPFPASRASRRWSRASSSREAGRWR